MGSVMVDIQAIQERRRHRDSGGRLRSAAVNEFSLDFLGTTDPSRVNSAHRDCLLAAANTGHRLPGCTVLQAAFRNHPLANHLTIASISSLALPLGMPASCRGREER